MPYSEPGGGGAAASIVAGNPVTGGGANRVLYEDASQNLATEAAFGYVETTNTLTVDNVTLTTITASGLCEFSGQTNISGPDATTNVEIGSTANDANAGTGGTSVVIGNSASNAVNATGVVLVGSGTTSGGSGGTSAIAIGLSNTIGNGGGPGTRGIAIGSGNLLNLADNVMIGHGLPAPQVNGEIQIGNVTGTAYSNMYIGKGRTSTTATAVTFNGTGGSGADNAGGGLKLAGGKGTGTAAGGDVILQASQRLGTGSTAQTLYDRHIVVAGTKTLTAAAATGVVRIGVPQGLTGPVGVTVFYSVRASDATDFQLRRGSVHIAAVNKAGTETAVISAASEAADGSVLAQSSASTLTYALTVASNAADTIDFEINAVSGLTETTLDVQYTVMRDHGTGTITPL